MLYTNTNHYTSKNFHPSKVYICVIVMVGPGSRRVPQLSNHPVYPHPAPPGLTNVICSNQPIKRAGLLYPDMQAVFDKVMKYSVFILYKGPTNTLL